ncbi:ATPase, AAA family [Ancylostoma duodenale]|uniref:ATPase, AAA family n=1 Tax=Ancylostoma duodenale TaxID=51022 RepID=A0A0C2D633_9BILA|nr:ATPase, AAA family [Ancylostoma duodenale]
MKFERALGHKYMVSFSGMIPDQDKMSLTSPQKCVMNGTCSHPERRGVKTFRPQVEIHLKKGVAKSQVDGRISELEAFIKVQRNIRNWIPIVVNEEPATGDSKSLTEFIQGIVVGCMNYPDAYPLDAILDKMTLCDQNVHFYKLHCDGAMSQSLSIDENSDESAMGSLVWELPSVEFENLWENLIYDSDLKNELMSYVHALIQLSDKGADMKVINVNRLIILLGPPGTGKTTLCRGVAQHLSIRLNSRFSTSAMVEINSHSLFSKWFSESGKLVLRMFDQIDEMAEDGKCLVFVLIDEVESLGMSRDASTSRGDPADSIRAVNALLTQIDRIRRRSNVIVLCTSNLEDCLDRALLDRADVVKHIGVVTSDERIPSIRELKDDDAIHPAGCELLELAKLAQGLSGRSIRQVPALAWSKADGDAVSLSACLSLFREAILEKAERCR